MALCFYIKIFHDQYCNQTVVLKSGVVKKWWPIVFFGMTLGQLDADIQKAYTMENVYGARRRSPKTLLLSFEYYGPHFLIKNLKALLKANYNINSNKNIDTIARL